MDADHRLYVRLIDGSDCFAPVVAFANPDGTFVISAIPEFDPDDTSTLPEFLPGDIVRAEFFPLFTPEQPPILIATELLRSSAQDRDYWAVLFAIAAETGKLPALSADRLAAISARVCVEVATGARWHYPTVVNWARGVVA